MTTTMDERYQQISIRSEREHEHTHAHTHTATSSPSERVSRPTRLRVVDVLTLALNLWELPGEVGEKSETRANGTKRGEQNVVRAKPGAWEGDCVISRKPVRRASIQRDCLALWTNLRSPSQTQFYLALFCTIDKLLPAKSIPPLCSSPTVNR